MFWIIKKLILKIYEVKNKSYSNDFEIVFLNHFHHYHVLNHHHRYYYFHLSVTILLESSIY